MERLLEMLDRLVEQGNTVVVIEHNLDVIKTADRIIDLGPEGGEEGGLIVAQGTPEQVAANERSYTGRFLRRDRGAGASAGRGAGSRPRPRLPRRGSDSALVAEVALVRAQLAALEPRADPP